MVQLQHEKLSFSECRSHTDMGHEKLSDELEARQKLEEKLEVDLNGLRSGIMRE